jgi:hypothetical protein
MNTYEQKVLNKLKNRENLLIKIDGDDADTFTYNEEKKRYESKFGYIDLQVIVKILNKDKQYDHLEIVLD